MFQTFDLLNILERPSSAPTGPGGSFAKRIRIASTDVRSSLDRPSADDDQLRHLEEKIEEQERHRIKIERRLKAREDELKALQEKRDVEARQQDEEAKVAQLKMHQEIIQLLIASMSTKKDSVVAPIIGSTSIVEPASVATIAPDVVSSIEVESRADLHMRKVSQNPPHLSLGSPTALPRPPSHS